MSNFFIDKDDGGYVMFRDTRKDKDKVASGKYGILGKFIEMMAASLDPQKDGETIVIETRKA